MLAIKCLSVQGPHINAPPLSQAEDQHQEVAGHHLEEEDPLLVGADLHLGVVDRHLGEEGHHLAEEDLHLESEEEG